MDELIRRNTLLEEYDKHHVGPPGGARKLIKEAPAVDAVPVVHGYWVGTADGYADGELVYDMWECSECGYDADGADEKPDWNYCPNCGAKMDLEETY